MEVKRYEIEEEFLSEERIRIVVLVCGHRYEVADDEQAPKLHCPECEAPDGP